MDRKAISEGIGSVELQVYKVVLLVMDLFVELLSGFIYITLVTTYVDQ